MEVDFEIFVVEKEDLILVDNVMDVDEEIDFLDVFMVDLEQKVLSSGILLKLNGD